MNFQKMMKLCFDSVAIPVKRLHGDFQPLYIKYGGKGRKYLVFHF
jgi:hypothetical protein